MSKASKMVVDAFLGDDSATVVVAGKPYFIDSPTIERIMKAAKYLSSVEGGNTMKDLIDMLNKLDDSCKALSIFIQGDEKLADELLKGTPQEIVQALETAYQLVSIQPFQKLSILARNVARLIARPRP